MTLLSVLPSSLRNQAVSLPSVGIIAGDKLSNIFLFNRRIQNKHILADVFQEGDWCHCKLEELKQKKGRSDVDSCCISHSGPYV